MSDDGEHALTIIAFIGSVFSPYYALARGLGAGDPLNHCALNVALYGARKHWALTERTRDDLRRSPTTLVIGPSRLHWDGAALSIEIDETTAPIPSPLKGIVRIQPSALTEHDFALDAGGRHRWRPLAPISRASVEMSKPDLRWSGHAYVDCNHGDEPLETAFRRWDWTRAGDGDGTTVLYDVERRDGSEVSLAFRFAGDGRVERVAPPPRSDLPVSLWRMRRRARSEDGAPTLVRTLEDTPFYARSLIASTLLGKRTVGVHESLSLDRVAHPLVRAMLPFRMPRLRSRRQAPLAR